MFSSYWIDWVNLTKEEKIITICFFAIMLGIGIIDYFYRKHKEKTKCDKNWLYKFFVIIFKYNMNKRIEREVIENDL